MRFCGGRVFGELSGGNWIASEKSLGCLGPGGDSEVGTGFRTSFSVKWTIPVPSGAIRELASAFLGHDSYLVDSASSHMLVSKIKPCMSKYKHLYTVKLRTAHYISYYLFDGTLLHGYP